MTMRRPALGRWPVCCDATGDLAMLFLPLLATFSALAGDVTTPERALTLAEAEAAALHNQPTLTEARGQLEAAEGKVEEARAGYLPQLVGTAQYQRTTSNFQARPGFNNATTTGTTMTGTTTPSMPVHISWDPTFDYYTLGATASQLIYDFGLTSNKWRSAGASRDAAREGRRTAELQTLFNVRRAFFQARAQHDLVAVAEETVRNQEKHVEQTRAFVRTGIQPDINLATVLTALANAKVQLVTAHNNDAVAGAQLAQAMGTPLAGRYLLSDDQMPAVPGEDDAAEPLYDRALRARPELANLQDQRRAQELTVDATRGSYGPALSGVANINATASNLTPLAPNWYAGLALSWNIFQGGLTRGQVREANGTLQNINGQEQAERLQVQVDVEQARLAVQAAKATIGAADEALTNARDQLTLAEGRYEHGLGSAVELSDAQVAYTSAEAQVVQARFGLASARAQLLAALGER
jgi:outer membrane protein